MGSLSDSIGGLSNQNGFSQNKDQFNEPSNLSGWQVLGKTFIGLVIGGIISAILFIALGFIGKMFTEALQQTSDIVRSNPLLPLLLLFIGFLSTFIGNIGIAGAYNLFFSKKYFDLSKMFGLLLLTNGILFFILAPIYLIFSTQIEILFFILGFHVFFSIFISANIIDFLTNPNYSASALMGNVLGFAMSFLMYSILRKSSISGSIQNQVYLSMLLPAIVGYTIIPFGSGIREKIYYKIYENGTNPLYISSSSEKSDNGSFDTNKEDQINIDL